MGIQAIISKVYRPKAPEKANYFVEYMQDGERVRDEFVFASSLRLMKLALGEDRILDSGKIEYPKKSTKLLRNSEEIA